MHSKPALTGSRTPSVLSIALFASETPDELAYVVEHHCTALGLVEVQTLVTTGQSGVPLTCVLMSETCTLSLSSATAGDLVELLTTALALLTESDERPSRH